MLVEWESDRVRLVDLQGYRRADSWPYNVRRTAKFTTVPNREIRVIAVHHSMGGFYQGIEAVEQLADWFLSPPKYRTDERGEIALDKRGKPIVIGGGKGWPGIGYQFVIPAIPDVVDGKIVVYRVWPDSMRTWHTGGLFNSHGVGICVGGHYTSAADPIARKSARPRPDDAAVTALDHLIDYLAGRYRLQLHRSSLVGHREVASTLCPGDFLADWIRAKRGEHVATPAGPEDRRPLDTALAIQQALVELGYAPGKLDGIWGPKTARSLKMFQEQAGVAADGIMGPLTERALRVALARM
jgi:hypothetical protein